ncbi:protein YoaR [Clostridium saccharobutylicum DSM 13864]|uniref:Protein YoaR n=1 Tax=Clostridium saccharobutylicum DSM 13864 TaxID=1345695 RepID=U5MWV3_CLOSA|nr:protein YoaR [Clostridium saccharobutylicum DSM 13864]
MNSNGKRIRTSKPVKYKMQRNTMLGMIGLAVVLAGALYAYSLSIKETVNKWEGKIYPGVTVQDVDIGGMTKEQAKDKLAETFNGAIGDKKLHISVEDKQFELIYSNIMPSYDIDGTVNEAYQFGKDDGYFKKYIDIKRGEFKKHQVKLNFLYDEEKLKVYEEKLQKDITQSAKDATLSIDGNNITVNSEVDGKTIDLDALDQKLKEAINGEISDNDAVALDVETTKPKVTKEDLAKVKGLIGTFSTNYSSSAPGRCNNIELATAAVNGTVVMPGETFSFNDVVGPRTVERGYKEAGTYVGNKVEPGIGGGICQVSTTLYRAVMKSNLRSVERTNHSMSVGYAKPGLDATVSYGYLDYKFKNTYDFPIYIQGITQDKNVTYNVYGDPSELNGKTYDMVSEILETIPPQSKVVDDSTLPVGQEISEGGGTTGYRARSYQVTYENGVEVNKEVISNDTYASVDVTVRKGTAQPEPTTDNTTTQTPEMPQDTTAPSPPAADEAKPKQ